MLSLPIATGTILVLMGLGNRTATLVVGAIILCLGVFGFIS